MFHHRVKFPTPKTHVLMSTMRLHIQHDNLTGSTCSTMHCRPLASLLAGLCDVHPGMPAHHPTRHYARQLGCNCLGRAAQLFDTAITVLLDMLLAQPMRVAHI
jgi:hypothetical protein